MLRTFLSNQFLISACLGVCLSLVGCDKKDEGESEVTTDEVLPEAPQSGAQPDTENSSQPKPVTVVTETPKATPTGTGGSDNSDNEPPPADTTAPGAPLGIYHAAGTTDATLSPMISWDASGSSDVAKYLVSLGTTSGAVDLVEDYDAELDLSHQLSGQTFVDCETYFASVKAVDDSGNTSEPTINGTGFIYDGANPSDPSGLMTSGTATVSASKQLDWTNSTDNCPGISYEVSIGESSGVADVIGWTNVGDVGTHTFIGITLESDKDYYFNLLARDASGRTSGAVSTAAWRLPGVPDAVSNLAVASRKKDAIELSWSAPFDNGAPILDYWVEYRVSPGGAWETFDEGVSPDTNTTVDGLDSNEEYDFRVQTYNGSLAAWSNVVTAETLIDDPFFESTSYKAMNLGGATASAVVAFEDDTEITYDGAIIDSDLDAGETLSFVSEPFKTIEANKPIFVAGRNGSVGGSPEDKGNVVWSSPDWAAKEFLFNINRMAPGVVTVYAFEAGHVYITDGGAPVADYDMAVGEVHTFDITNVGSYEMSSAGLIMAFVHSAAGGKIYDPRPIIPKGKDIIGFPSTTMDMTSGTNGNNYTYFHSDGTTDSDTLTAGVSVNLGAEGTTSLYQSHSLRIIADDDIIGASYADSNGYCSAPFLPVSMMRKRYAINVNADYVAFASIAPGVITMIEPDGTTTPLTLVGTGDPNVPYKVRVGTTLAGTRFESTVRYGAWYQPNTNTDAGDEDETILFGFD